MTDMSGFDIPAHVPEELVRDFDLYSPPGMVDGHTDDLHSVWKGVQDTMPSLFWTPRNGGHWVLTRHDDIRGVALNPKTFSNRENQIPLGVAPYLVPVNVDPPEHGAFRKLLMPWFSPARLAEVTDQARKTATTIIEELQPKGRCEFFSDFAGVMPIVAFLTLVNLPRDDLLYLRNLSSRMTPAHPEVEEAWAEMAEYVNRHIANRRANPQNDAFSALHTATVFGRPLTDKEIFDMSLLLVSGGLDTVVNATCFSAEFLARSPAHRRELIEHPERIDSAVEELMRRFGISNLGRVVVEDTELRGVEIRAGDAVLLPFPLAGLDETVNEDPMTVDFQRKAPKHLQFSTGPHTCIGNRLAKREIRIFLEEWLTRIPDFELAPGHKPRMKTGVVNHIEELQLVWNPA